ncbi:hypothetical protein E308F_12030 [Moorella sp. E308F]|nr:hypothetical protein [Moorella sp. E308F]GEA14959.1 hypothetical protein E308F_12030 [Moorella sp. E308F]GEA17614.1 hypothetical protein E306M_07480 [Moorella sp. E306M]
MIAEEWLSRPLALAEGFFPAPAHGFLDFPPLVPGEKIKDIGNKFAVLVVEVDHLGGRDDADLRFPEF